MPVVVPQDPGGSFSGVFATVDDVVRRWRPLSDGEAAMAGVLVEEATALLSVTAPGLRGRVAADPDLGLAARSVTVSMVLRVMKNPDAIRQFSIDDYSRTRDAVASGGLLHVTPEELASLLPPAAVSGGFGGAYMVPLSG